MTHAAVIQMTSTADLAHNMELTQTLVTQAAAAGAKLVLLPENFAMMSSGKLLEVARQEAEIQHLTTFISQLARTTQTWVVAGSAPLLDTERDDRVKAACLVFDDQGELQARYDKIHLFDVDVADSYGRYRESDTISPGSQIQVVDTPCGKLGLSICYDVRFPALYAGLVDAGAELICVPAAFTYETGKAHWETLLKARAIEHQCYILGANQTGQHSPKRRTWGHSMIIDAWGAVLAQSEEEPGVLIADIDLPKLHAVRAAMPLQQHRRKIN